MLDGEGGEGLLPLRPVRRQRGEVVQERLVPIRPRDALEQIVGCTSDEKAEKGKGRESALYIQQELRPLEVKITRLAQGLPIGVDLEYADQITLGRALERRQDVKE